MMKAALARKSVWIAGLIAGTILCDSGPGVADTDLLIIGGAEGKNGWEAGSYTLESNRVISKFSPATISTDRRSVDVSNTPGDVVDQECPDRINWIFPSSSDTNTSIMKGFDSEARGGQVFTPIPSFRFLAETFPLMTDGSSLTAMVLEAEDDGSSAGARGFILDFDLGSVFGVNRIRFFPRPSKQRDFMKGYDVRLNDGTPEMVAGGAKIYETIGSETDNSEVDVDIRFETQFVRHIRVRSLSPAGFEIAEFEVYTEGFVPTAVYVSDVMDFGEKVILGKSVVTRVPS